MPWKAGSFLRNWHSGQQDVKPWLNYFWGVLLRAYHEFEERVGGMITGKGSKAGLVRSAVNRRVAPFSINDIESGCPGISRETIRQVLRNMREEGAIIVSSGGRGAIW